VDGTLSTDPRRGTLYLVLGNGETGTFGGDYRLDLDTSGRFDVWIVDHDLGDTLLGPRFRGPFVEQSGTVTVPGTASEVLTVGASITYAVRETDRGEVRIDGTSGEVATFSSVGPPPGGRAKPDLVAPGALIVTALSSDAVDGDPENLFRGATDRIARQRVAPDRIALKGTSFTAPLAAGVIALALPDDPREDALDWLRYTARPADAPWDPRAGFGYLDAEAFVARTRAPIGASLVATAPVDLASPYLVVAGRVTGAEGPFSGPVELFLDGALQDTVDARAGIVRDFASLPTLFAGESVTLEARVNGERAGGLVVRGRIDAARERSAPAAMGGGAGCAAARGRAGAGLFVLVLFFLSRGRHLRSRRSRHPGGSAKRYRGCPESR
jgi:subtilisin family serine protease